MTPHPSANEELCEARRRIAALERELEALRSAAVTPHPSQRRPVLPSSNTASPHHHLKPARLISKTRPLIMTRRASAAAAAAAAAAPDELQEQDTPSATPQLLPSEQIAEDAEELQQPQQLEEEEEEEEETVRPLERPPSPLDAALLDLSDRSEPPQNPSSSDLSESHKLSASADDSDIISADCSDNSHNPSEHSSTARSPPKTLTCDQQSSSATEEPHHGSDEYDNGTNSHQQQQTHSEKNNSDDSPIESDITHVQPAVIEAVTPEISSPPAPDKLKGVSVDDRKLLSSPIIPTAAAEPAPNSPPATAAATTSPSVATTQPISPSPSPPTKSTTAAAAPVSPAPRRRPPPLPVLKTSSTKKERYHLVAKCTEPKPGQTRYWTDDEHDRFLEAVAEYGEKAYVAISNYVETRTPKQVRTHAQKFQMKMARLAKQSIEAGRPIQMPAGMRPIVQMPSNSVLPVSPTQMAVPGKTGQQNVPGQVPVVVVVPPSTQPQGGKKRGSKKSASVSAKPVDGLVRIASTVSDESSSTLTDPYLNYIGAAAADSKVEMELENSFAAKLSQTLHDSSTDAVSRDGDFLMSDGASNDSASMGNDDDLEDLEKLEDGDLSLAPFSNPSDNWLLPDTSMSPA